MLKWDWALKWGFIVVLLTKHDYQTVVYKSYNEHSLAWRLDILLNVFLAIAVDNLADAENMTKIDKEEKKRKKEERKIKRFRKRTALTGGMVNKMSTDSEYTTPAWVLI